MNDHLLISPPRSAKPALLALAGLLLAGTPLRAAVIAVDWTGDYVSASASLSGDTVAGAGVYEDPDASGSGAGALAGRSLNWSTPFSPPAPYGSSTGGSATFYGGAVAGDIDGTGNDGYEELAVLNQGSNDSLHLRVQSNSSSRHTLDALFIWTKSDFAGGMNFVPNLNLGGDGYFHFDTSQSGGGHNDGSFTLRWAVVNGAGKCGVCIAGHRPGKQSEHHAGLFTDHRLGILRCF